MHSLEAFRQIAERNYGVIKLQTKDLTNEDSLIQPPFRGNCLNWVLGHITYYRSRLLGTLGEPADWLAEQLPRYQRESEPITGATEGVLSLEQLLNLLEQSQERLVAALQQLPAESLQEVKGEKTVGELFTLLQWHETYHLGQLEFLRQLAGKNDKVI
jgi:uncharacterized damage-inducible protein DinB